MGWFLAVPDDQATSVQRPTQPVSRIPEVQAASIPIQESERHSDMSRKDNEGIQYILCSDVLSISISSPDLSCTSVDIVLPCKAKINIRTILIRQSKKYAELQRFNSSWQENSQ